MSDALTLILVGLVIGVVLTVGVYRAFDKW